MRTLFPFSIPRPMKYLFIPFFLVPFLSSVNGQNEKVARDLFEKRDFEGAMEEYLLLHEEDPDKLEYNYRIGVCYLNTNIDKSKAVPYLKKAVQHKKADPNALYLLGRAYHLAYKFDKAIDAYYDFKEKGKGSEFNLKKVDRQIAYCENAKELMKFPVDVDFIDLGDPVNSLYKDYYPFVPADESYLLFNSRRKEKSIENRNGTYRSNVYISRVAEGEFTEASLVKSINTEKGNEEVVGLSREGDKVLLYMDDGGRYGYDGDLYVADLVNGRIKEPNLLPESINSDKVEIAASITDEKDAIIFASNRKGGHGGVDLYVSKKLPNGKWSSARNLGPGVNTEEDEDFPNLSPDGSKLYFSSKGHTSMGGYDIFSAEWDTVKRRWGKVKNIGYPINTPDDNMNFRISRSGKYGYISSLREKGHGNLDVYRVEFKGVDPRYTVIKGYLRSQDTGRMKVKRPMISVTDKATGEVYGDYTPDSRTMRYIMILPPGKFHIFVDAPGFEPHEEDIEILDKSSYRPRIDKDFTLIPEEGE